MSRPQLSIPYIGANGFSLVVSPAFPLRVRVSSETGPLTTKETGLAGFAILLGHVPQLVGHHGYILVGLQREHGGCTDARQGRFASTTSCPAVAPCRAQSCQGQKPRRIVIGSHRRNFFDLPGPGSLCEKKPGGPGRSIQHLDEAGYFCQVTSFRLSGEGRAQPLYSTVQKNARTILRILLTWSL